MSSFNTVEIFGIHEKQNENIFNLFDEFRRAVRFYVTEQMVDAWSCIRLKSKWRLYMDYRLVSSKLHKEEFLNKRRVERDT